MEQTVQHLTTIFGFIISLGSIFGIFTGVINHKNKQLTDQMKQLEETVKEHNGYAKKFVEVSGEIKLIKQQLEFQAERDKEFKEEMKQIKELLEKK